MSILTIAVFALLVAWCLHLAAWRVRLPKSQLKALLLIFVSVWAVVVAASLAAGWPIRAVIEFLYFSLIYWSAALCYVITYSAMEGDSPTLSLTRHLHRRGEEGVSHKEIETFFR